MLLAIDYIFKCVKAKAICINNDKVVVDFVKTYNFSRVKIPKAIISDHGMTFVIDQ
jgi:hypothetical protein